MSINRSKYTSSTLINLAKSHTARTHLHTLKSQLKKEQAQSTVEAAYLIPILLLVLLILIQPSIILYDRMVMQAAASEGCRMLCTKTNINGDTTQACEAYILRRLGSIPPVDIFHVHDGGCSWNIEMSGDETAEEVLVSLSNKITLLPLIGTAGDLSGITDANGFFTIETSVSMPTQPEWLGNSELGYDSQAWLDRFSE